MTRRRIKKTVVLTLLFLLAGTVVNVAAAWAFRVAYHRQWLGDPYAARIEASVGAADAWPWSPPEGWPLRPDRSQHEASLGLTGMQIERSDAFNRVRYSFEPDLPSHTMSRTQWGWPWRSVETRDQWSDDDLWWTNPAIASLRLRAEMALPTWSWDRGWLCPFVPRPFGPFSDSLRLPVRPVAWGFAGNTLMYGAFLYALSLAPRVARRWVRRKRGACMACGYSLRGTATGVCPECGRPS